MRMLQTLERCLMRRHQAGLLLPIVGKRVRDWWMTGAPLSLFLLRAFVLLPEQHLPAFHALSAPAGCPFQGTCAPCRGAGGGKMMFRLGWLSAFLQARLESSRGSRLRKALHPPFSCRPPPWQMHRLCEARVQRALRPVHPR